MNRGSDSRERGPAVLDHASMRPRFMNRGSAVAAAEAKEKAENASMRPRFMNRGSALHRHRREATVDASMRPRFMNRGSSSLRLH